VDERPQEVRCPACDRLLFAAKGRGTEVVVKCGKCGEFVKMRSDRTVTTGA
jgi:phage FluMu protein Com